MPDQDAMALAISILTTGKVPVFYVSESEIQKAGDTWTADDNNGPRDVPGDPPPEDIREKDLDVHVTLNLDYLPSPKERSRMVNAAGKMIRVTLPGLVAENKDYVVKDGGKTDPKTGLTGDAYVRVKCKHSYFRPNSLGNILKDIRLLLVVVLYAIFFAVKTVVTAVFKLVFSKVGIVLIVLAAAVFVICHFLGVF